jgi:hypothetical protein
MSEPGGTLDGEMLRAIAAARGVTLTAAEAELLARRSAPLYEEFRRLARSLCADDDTFAFRRILEQEGAGG